MAGGIPSHLLRGPSISTQVPRTRSAVYPTYPHVNGVPQRLHIGCGNRRLAGWINADAVKGVGDVVMDLQTSPLAQSAYSEIYGSHVLEHCWPQDTPGILKKLFNALVPGGTLRLSVPDLRLIVKNCVDSNVYGDERSALSTLYGGTFSSATAAPDLHRQAFWHERLSRLLTEAGFVNVREWNRGQYPAIDALKDYATFPFDHNTGKSTISLNIEANRPGELPRIRSNAPIDISFILGTVNRPQMLQECVESIRKNVSGIPYEIVIAYGRHDDASLAWMRAQNDIVPILGGMEGAIEAFNRAYTASQGRLICQINDDVTIDEDSIAKAIKHIDSDLSCAGVVFKFDRGDGKGYRHEHIGLVLHPNQMVMRREICEAIIERIGAFWGDTAHRTDKTYGGDSAFGVVCHHLGLRLDSVVGVTCRDHLVADALRTQNAVVAQEHGPKWLAMYGPLIEQRTLPPTSDEWPNLYLPAWGKPPRRSPVPAGRPLRLLHLSLQSKEEPQVDMRRAFAQIGPTVEMPWMLGHKINTHAILAAVQNHQPEVIWAQVHGPWPTDFQKTLRVAAGPNCTLIQWTGDVRTNNAQPVARWLVDFGQHFDILLADGCAYPRKLKLTEHVPAACGYLQCGIDPHLNPWRPDSQEAGNAVFLGNTYPSAYFGETDRVGVLEEVNRLTSGLLTIYGTGWETTPLRAIAQPFVPQEHASHVMRAALITVAMSIYNDMARYTSDRLKRAMASGAVVAVRRFPDMEGLGLRDGHNCLYWSTSAELAGLIQEWTKPEHSMDRNTIRQNAAKLAHERFTWDRTVEELLAIVRDHRARKGLI